MADGQLEYSPSGFMEEVHRYKCLYNKYSKDFRDKLKKLNAWKAVSSTFLDLSPADAEAKFKNIRSAYTRFLRKVKSTPSGSGREAIPTPREFANLEWLACFIEHRPTWSNMPKITKTAPSNSGLNTSAEVYSYQENAGLHQNEDEIDEQENAILNVSADYELDTGSTNEELLVVSNLKESSVKVVEAGKENSTEKKQKRNSIDQAKVKKGRPWALCNKKFRKKDIDIAIIETAKSLSQQLQKDREQKRSARS